MFQWLPLQQGLVNFSRAALLPPPGKPGPDPVSTFYSRSLYVISFTFSGRPLPLQAGLCYCCNSCTCLSFFNAISSISYTRTHMDHFIVLQSDFVWWGIGVHAIRPVWSAPSAIKVDQRKICEAGPQRI